MQVFKLYCKLTKKNIWRMIMYIGLFCAILFGAVIPGRSGSGSDEYINQTVKYAILDQDESELSKGFSQYLEDHHEKVSIKDFDMVTVQDELYNRNIRAAVVIKEGFEEAFLEGHGEDYMVIYDIPDNTACKIFANNVSEYFEYVDTYIKNGETTADASKKAAVIMNISARAMLAGGEDSSTDSGLYIFYLYMPWVLVAMMVESLTSILIKLDDKEVKNRISCSSYHFVNMNGEIALGVLLTGVAVCGLLFFLSNMLLGNGGPYGYLFVINMCIMMFIAISIAFLLSKIIKNQMVISMVTNVISLGMSFLCGVFVPMEFLGEGVIKVAHFLPAYWYVTANKDIDSYNGGSMQNILQCFCIELLFGVSLFLIGMVIANKRRKAS